jgi:hypothetical protein
VALADLLSETMNQNVIAGAVVGFMALLAVVALAAGLGGSTSVSYDNGPEVPAPTEGEGGLVYGKHETGGFVLFGMEFNPRDRWLSVGFVASDECMEQDDEGEEVVIASGDCGELPAHGLVEGGGTTPEQVVWVIVRVDVPRKCFEVVSVGDAWPSEVAECGAG